MNKVNNLKKKLYFIRFDLLFKKYLKNEKITKFDGEIYEKMNDTFISCLPVSFCIKYSNYIFPHGTCYERSLYMFLALDDAVLVRGKKKTLEYNYGKEQDGHGWIELGDYVYDPSLMLKFDRDVYYSLYGCSDIKKITKKEYFIEHKDFVSNSVSYNINDYKPNGDKRLDVGLRIFQLKALCGLLNDEQFTDDLIDYLNMIEYDEEQIYKQRQDVMRKILDKKENIANL